MVRACAVVALAVLPALGQAIPQPVLFDPAFQAKPVRIVEQTELASLRPPTALVRLANGKLAIMAQDEQGTARPWLVRGIENSFRPTPAGTNLDQIFANYRRLGSNTAVFMIHWMEIEPADGKFDFSHTDEIVAAAKKNGVKIWWLLFLHCQSDHPANLRDFWLYQIDSHDGKDYAMQWLKDENGVVYDSLAKLKTLDGRWEITPAYGNPQVMPRILRMLGRLGERYKDSNSVLGVQIDNEAGFGYYTNARSGPNKLTSDYNTVTGQIFDEWKLKTGKTDLHAFKLAIVKYWWKQFTTAYHNADPYKLTSFNFYGSLAEAGDPAWIDLEGVDVTTYGEGNIDVIDPMFYGPGNGPKIFKNLDEHYDPAFRLPIFLSSEIGLSGSNAMALFQQYVINSLERGAQGYTAYAYGNLVRADALTTQGEFYRSLAAMIEANEDIIHPGVPGPGPVSITTSAEGYRISQLNLARIGTLGMLHFPAAAFQRNPDSNQAKADVTVELKALAAGTYVVEIYRAGKLATTSTVTLAANETHQQMIAGVGQTEAVFIKVKRQTT
jgi:hypothetical protein